MTAENSPENRGSLVPPDYDGPILRITPEFQRRYREEAERILSPKDLEGLQVLARELEIQLAVPTSPSQAETKDK